MVLLGGPRFPKELPGSEHSPKPAFSRARTSCLPPAHLVPRCPPLPKSRRAHSCLLPENRATCAGRRRHFCHPPPESRRAAAQMSVSTPTVGSEAMSAPPREFLATRPYAPPDWARGLLACPDKQLCLAHLPTPIHKWNVPGLPEGTNLFIKRDDLSGMELSGNKVRKLECILPRAVEEGADCVVTIGGIQSNHCRATTVAAAYLGLPAHLVLRTSKTAVGSDPGLVGNLLVERLCGANVHLVSKEEYAQHGSIALGQTLVELLRAQGKRPYLIPVGGSNALGCWGYIEAIREIEDQLRSGTAGGASSFDVIAMACGSGGTSAGIALGSHLSSLKAQVRAYGVCDSPRYFYDYIQGLLNGLSASCPKSEDLLQLRDVKGLGYAISTDDELRLVRDVAKATGIVLDPVYSGKALKGLLDDIKADPEAWAGRNVLFVHTGGLLGMYDKLQQLQPLVGDWQRLKLE